MGRGPGGPFKTLRPPHRQGGRRRSSIGSTLHLMGIGPGQSVETHGPHHGPGGAAHMKPTNHGPRLGPAHQISREWAAARPTPSNAQRMGRGPARAINYSEGGPRPGPSHFQTFTARPAPANQNFKSLGPVRHHFQLGPARPGQTTHGKPWYSSNNVLNPYVPHPPDSTRSYAG